MAMYGFIFALSLIAGGLGQLSVTPQPAGSCQSAYEALQLSLLNTPCKGFFEFIHGKANCSDGQIPSICGDTQCEQDMADNFMFLKAELQIDCLQDPSGKVIFYKIICLLSKKNILSAEHGLNVTALAPGLSTITNSELRSELEAAIRSCIPSQKELFVKGGCCLYKKALQVCMNPIGALPSASGIPSFG